MVPLVWGTLTVNEQTRSVSGSTGTIIVNALHLTTLGGADLRVGSSNAGITTGANNCGPADSVTTGGGYITPAGSNDSFGLVGGMKGGSPFGHITYVEHGGVGNRVEGTVDTYLHAPNSPTAQMSGPATVNGQTIGRFTIATADNGEPGKNSDAFTISTTTGITASGTLAGGNIQQHDKACP